MWPNLAHDNVVLAHLRRLRCGGQLIFRKTPIWGMSARVSLPTGPRVTRRVGAPRPLPALYCAINDIAPGARTRTPKPSNSVSMM
jgi:hypothetical protein